MQEGGFTERRRVQRVRLPNPMRATLDGTRVFILDLSLRGLRVLHQEPLAHQAGTCVVVTEWDGARIELQCTIVRTGKHPQNRYQSGLSIVSAAGASHETLRALVAHHVERALDEQKANARGIPPSFGAAQSVKTGAPDAFVRHEYILGRWREVMTPTSNQPENGFTICASHSRDEVEMLRRAYETAGTNEERTTIRRLAAMSVSSSEAVQARRYTP
jgi:hypothetical protein